MSAALIITQDGAVECLYTEAIDLSLLGPLQIRRATDIAFDNTLQRWTVRDGGNRELYSHCSREACLEWERDHLRTIGDAKHGGVK